MRSTRIKQDPTTTPHPTSPEKFIDTLRSHLSQRLSKVSPAQIQEAFFSSIAHKYGHPKQPKPRIPWPPNERLYVSRFGPPFHYQGRFETRPGAPWPPEEEKRARKRKRRSRGNVNQEDGPYGQPRASNHRTGWPPDGWQHKQSGGRNHSLQRSPAIRQNLDLSGQSQSISPGTTHGSIKVLETRDKKPDANISTVNASKSDIRPFSARTNATKSAATRGPTTTAMTKPSPPNDNFNNDGSPPDIRAGHFTWDAHIFYPTGYCPPEEAALLEPVYESRRVHRLPVTHEVRPSSQAQNLSPSEQLRLNTPPGATPVVLPNTSEASSNSGKLSAEKSPTRAIRVEPENITRSASTSTSNTQQAPQRITKSAASREPAAIVTINPLPSHTYNRYTATVEDVEDEYWSKTQTPSSAWNSDQISSHSVEGTSTEVQYRTPNQSTLNEVYSSRPPSLEISPKYTPLHVSLEPILNMTRDTLSNIDHISSLLRNDDPERCDHHIETIITAMFMFEKLEELIDRCRNISRDEWKEHTQSWYRKYCERLRVIEVLVCWFHQSSEYFYKNLYSKPEEIKQIYEQFDAAGNQLFDVIAKINASLDRLGRRYLHVCISQPGAAPHQIRAAREVEAAQRARARIDEEVQRISTNL